MSLSREGVIECLRRVRGPDMQSNIVDLGMVSEILLKDGRVSFSITVPAARATELEPLRQAAEKIVRDMEGVTSVLAVLTAEKPRGATSGNGGGGGTQVPESARVQQARARTSGAAAPAAAPTQPAAAGGRQIAQIAGIKHLIAVASGKGGVGKSTTAVNLALGLQAAGLKTGILDADIYGPSQPRLLGLSGRPQAMGNKLQPMQAYGLKAMSMGFLVDEGTPIIWRGPMVVSALTQMLRDVEWGELDVLVIDMPPGTGDVQLTMAQQVPLSGAIIVSTPQDLALIDARKGLNMFRKVDVPVLGIIENMSYFVCPKCGERSDIFGHGGAKAEAEKLGIAFLGGVPLHMDIRATSDDGRPIVASSPDSIHAQIYRDIAARAWEELQGAKGARIEPPKLVIVAGGTELSVTFEGAKPFLLSAEMLRVMSPSAEVQGHSPDQRVTVGRKRKVKIKELRPVGNYAMRIVFDDGHDTGLYAWSYLQILDREREQRWAEYLASLAQKGLDRG
jgi:ATP-binding protein involved in chromosome partitioning